MYILGLDYGAKHVGVAVGQAITKTAKPLTTIKYTSINELISSIKKLMDDWRVEKIIVGLPLNMDGSEQDITQKVKIFVKKLQDSLHIPIILEDERLSTWEAKKMLKIGYKDAVPAKLVEKVNSLSASIILEQYLQSN